MGEGVQVEIDDVLGRIVFEREGVIVRVNLGGEDWNDPVPPGFSCVLSGPSVTVLEREGNDG